MDIQCSIANIIFLPYLFEKFLFFNYSVPVFYKVEKQFLFHPFQRNRLPLSEDSINFKEHGLFFFPYLLQYKKVFKWGKEHSMQMVFTYFWDFVFGIFFLYSIFCRPWNKFLFHMASFGMRIHSFINIAKERDMGRTFSNLVPTYVYNLGLYRYRPFFFWWKDLLSADFPNRRQGLDYLVVLGAQMKPADHRKRCSIVWMPQ